MEVIGLVLAAGGGRRHCMPKALIDWHGRLLVQRVIFAARYDLPPADLAEDQARRTR